MCYVTEERENDEGLAKDYPDHYISHFQSRPSEKKDSDKLQSMDDSVLHNSYMFYFIYHKKIEYIQAIPQTRQIPST